jgi:peptidoglycan/LPS O-acetylase OafA/YrhL
VIDDGTGKEGCVTAFTPLRQTDRTEPRSTQIRPDIQALRALAVSLVLVYHLWPGRLTGGYVGVDVFFVISGFLITTHLLTRSAGGARGLLDFWARRVRRLLPASLLVLTVTLLATRLVAPDTLWESTASQVRAAATYSLNWQLAKNSVDYLAAQSAPTPVIHFWSLSVEEQFYAGWPLLLLLLASVSARRRVVAIGIGLVCAVSFAYSVYYTSVEPARAYFVTPTRIWELAAGGLLAALAPKARKQFSHVVAGAGLAGIAVAAVWFSASTPFPGWAAALPVLATVALIWARPSWPVLSARPVQWLGDISYSLYLWHWPLIVLVPFVSGGHLGWIDKSTIVVVSLALAGLTKRFVEDRFRKPRGQARLGRPFVLAAAGMAAVVAVASGQIVEVHSREATARQALSASLSNRGSCFGAAAMVSGSGCTRATVSGTLVPAPIEAAKDLGPVWYPRPGPHDCFADPPSFTSVNCTFGPASAAVRVALVGNSHAGEWSAAVLAVAKSHGWQVTTFLASQCALSSVLQHFPTTAVDHACYRWVQRTVNAVTSGHYDLVVMADRISVTALGEDYPGSLPVYQRGYEAVLRRLVAAREPVVGIRDTPAPVTLIPNCLAEHTTDYLRCEGTRAKWLPPDPMIDAVKSVDSPAVHLANLTNYLCGPIRCPAAIGGVPVYFDGSHMTATYARTLAPYLRPFLTAALSP